MDVSGIGQHKDLFPVQQHLPSPQESLQIKENPYGQASPLSQIGDVPFHYGDQAHSHGPALSAEEQKSVTAAIRGFLLRDRAAGTLRLRYVPRSAGT
uniref:Uncharacterized protein n=1 Tax=Daphnia galeata TaxID=27404 RepID=A0A8J2WHC7_9CRUS|nr:unnamed protein product [Daphnia galeata]